MREKVRKGGAGPRKQGGVGKAKRGYRQKAPQGRGKLMLTKRIYEKKKNEGELENLSKAQGKIVEWCRQFYCVGVEKQKCERETQKKSLGGECSDKDRNVVSIGEREDKLAPVSRERNPTDVRSSVQKHVRWAVAGGGRRPEHVEKVFQREKKGGETVSTTPV